MDNVESVDVTGKQSTNIYPKPLPHLLNRNKLNGIEKTINSIVEQGYKSIRFSVFILIFHFLNPILILLEQYNARKINILLVGHFSYCPNISILILTVSIY